jgi:hypothetical protein
MSKAIDHDLKTSAHEVQRLMGQCILRLQAYELLLKSVVTAHEISSPIATLATAQTDRADEIRSNTLGMLIRQMLGSFLVPQGQEGKGQLRNDAPSVTFRMQIILTQDDFNTAEADLRNLVDMRNHLVHHFIEEHDVRTLEGCLKAQEALAQALDYIGSAHSDLRSWAEDLEATRERVADQFVSAEVLNFFVEGRVPWRRMVIVRALKEAAQALAEGGWAPVDSAVRWVNARYPDERPDDYGCTSWRQVIHESRLFDLQNRTAEGPRQAWFRPRD